MQRRPDLGEDARAVVSILTGFEEPVQPLRSPDGPAMARGFNPHRLRGAGATPRQAARGPRRSSRFNPHRLRGAGATSLITSHGLDLSPFQSSPASRSRCNTTNLRTTNLKNVSILTGFEEPVQHRPPPGLPGRRGAGFNPHRLRGAGATPTPTAASARSSARFQSSPASRSRCN